MKQRTIRIIKIILGAYLTFIGSVHFINIYDQKPSDMYLQIMIAFVFIIVGVMYMIWDVRKLVEKVLREKAELAAQKEAEERERRYKELHSSDKFRTAPMRVIRPISFEKIKENETTENIRDKESEESKESEIGIKISEELESGIEILEESKESESGIEILEESKESEIGIEISEEIESLKEE